MDYSFSIFNKFAETGITTALSEIIEEGKSPVFLCIGSDLALGDSLGPLTGTMLQNKGAQAFIYGTLKKPVTAKEIKYINSYIKEIHPKSVVIAIDAAIGDSEDIGLIKIYDKGLKPGLGADKNLCCVGDISILGIVAVKSFLNYSLLNSTRLNLIYRMSDIISSSLCNYLSCIQKEITA
jgi:putative sporulation protein YyaC